MEATAAEEVVEELETTGILLEELTTGALLEELTTGAGTLVELVTTGAAALVDVGTGTTEEACTLDDSTGVVAAGAVYGVWVDDR